MHKMNLCSWFRKIFGRKEDSCKVDRSVVGDSERIVRFLLSPFHIKKDGQLRSNVFNPTIETDEISVNRLEILSIEQTKPIAKRMAANRSGDDKYCGFALHTKHSAVACGAKDVIPEPLENNEAHAEIKLGVVRKDSEIPAEILEVKDKLAEKSKLLLDPNPDEDGWSGPEPIYP